MIYKWNIQYIYIYVYIPIYVCFTLQIQAWSGYCVACARGFSRLCPASSFVIKQKGVVPTPGPQVP